MSLESGYWKPAVNLQSATTANVRQDDKGEIASEISSIVERLGFLNEALDHLAKRLDPVTIRQPSTSENGQAVCVARSTSLGQALQSINGQVTAAGERVRELLETLAL